MVWWLMKGLFNCLSIVCALSVLPVVAASVGFHDRTFFSSDKHCRFEAIQDFTGVQPGSWPTATKGVLSKQEKTGDYATVWSVTLVNQCGPGTVLVPNDGRDVVTLGDWFPRPEENFVVVYGGDGRVIKRWSLNDLLADTGIPRPPVWDHRDDNGRMIGISDGGDLNRPQILKPYINESDHRLLFQLRAREGPGDYQVKDVTVDLRTGRIWCH
jgi:hypothetical protein